MSKKLIKNADWIITMDEDKRRLRRSDVLIDGAEIVALGKNLISEEDVDEIIDAIGKIIIPGMVNTHHHCFQSLVRNIHVANELSLMPWLKVVYNIFQDITPEVADAGALIGLGELLKSGCTTSMDHHYAFPRSTDKKLIDVTINAAQKLGIRFQPTRGSLSIGGGHIPDSLVETVDDILIDSERLIKTYHDNSKFSMLQVDLSPCWPEYDVPELWDESMKMAKKYGVGCHSHLAESKDEVEYCLEKFNCRPAEYVYRKGWMGPRVWFAHSVHLTDSDIELFAKTGTGIAHCPISNMKLNSGICRVPNLIDAGVNIGIGVDGAASNNASNMLSEIRVSYLMHQLQYGNKGPNAEKILEMATVGGAKVLGRTDIGYLAPGMAADMVLIDWNQFELAGGQNDPVSVVVMSGDSKMVNTVLVNGEVVVEEGKLVNIDEENTAVEVNKIAKNMLRKASVREKGLELDLR
ncbi:8-oxoguanine deaminase [Clostridium sediminicola]|uniref:amidohydrolase family protein n=1 Tax=Clostridium sediminicola TaxID=3114879 RepID=UPI0031F2188F